jgi:UDP-N-acetylmuramoylalanine--D-glutamate ligase
MDRHKTMKEYIAAKLSIFENQRAEDFAVLNFDDPIVRENAGETGSKKYWFSGRREVNGAYVRGDKIYFGGSPVCGTGAFKLPGVHNLENALAAVTVLKILDADNADIERGLSGFPGVPHRLELVAESGGVRFFNDSKATNIDSALRAVNSVAGYTALILGGSDKGYEYDALFKGLPPHIGRCIFIGAVADKLKAAADRTGYGSYTFCPALRDAVEEAVRSVKAAGGGNVLLSPASASFDMFKNFEHRGEAFREIVVRGGYEKGASKT